jgi:hypothetical protein
MSKTSIANSIKHNQELAYCGEVGKRRAEYCIHYYKFKKRLIEEISADQRSSALKQKRTITCHKGCSFCCGQLIQASLGECELITFYLYQNEKALDSFNSTFPAWLQRAQEQPVFHIIGEAQQDRLDGKINDKSLEKLSRELKSYWELQILCPFIVDNSCSIYEVRPWACTSVVSLSPSTWCDPVAKKQAKTIFTKMSPDIHLHFYDEHTSTNLPVLNMPVAVHRMLTEGLKYYLEFPWLHSLYDEFLADETVKKIIRDKPAGKRPR